MLIEGIYILDSESVHSSHQATCHSVSVSTWHNTLGHLSHSHLQKLHKSLPTSVTSPCNINPCYICPVAKQKGLRFDSSTSVISTCFESFIMTFRTHVKCLLIMV